MELEEVDYSSSTVSDEDVVAPAVSADSHSLASMSTMPSSRKRARGVESSSPMSPVPKAIRVEECLSNPYAMRYLCEGVSTSSQPSQSSSSSNYQDISITEGANELSSTEILRLHSAVKKYKSLALDTEQKYKQLLNTHNQLLQDLHEMVECPVCFNVPRVPPVACCKNGHLLCDRCRPKMQTCPTCRVQLSSQHVSLVAAGILEKIDHPCDFRDEGCSVKLNLKEIGLHEASCPYRLVRCPHWACDERITAVNLTHHVIANECGDNYRSKLMPYKEEMEYTRALDDEEGNGFWRPSLLEYDDITFYLQVEKLGTTKNWYFYLQMEGSPSDCEKYGVTIKVSKTLDSDRYSTVYNGSVCPVDIKGAVEVEAHGCGLNIRDAQMEKIFVKQIGNTDHGGSNSEDDDGEERYKFWIVVDIYSVSDEAM